MKLTYAELQAIVTSFVTANKISYGTYSAVSNNIAGLYDKVGLIVTLDTVYQTDKLSFFDGEYMPLGKNIEEWAMDLTLPEDYDSTGANALAPHDPTFRPVFYSFSLGRKVIPTTIRNNNIERGVNNLQEFVSIVSMVTKKMEDSMASYRYNLKREIIAKFIGLCNDAMAPASVFAKGTSYVVGTYLKNASTATDRGIVVRAYTANDATDWADAKAKGFIVSLTLTETIAVPTDTSTSEAFIKAVKKDVEKASDQNEGNSLNGNSLGATEGLVLLVKQGIIPTLEVDAIAGAFNKDQLALPAEVVVVKDFGSDNSGAFAVLVDRRAIRLHNTYRSVKEQPNAKGDFLNLYEHTEDTGYISRNAFVKVYLASN